MLRGLESRRIALFSAPENDAVQRRAGTVRRALEAAGARVDVLEKGKGANEDWHGARYAALVIIGDDTAAFDADPRLVQLAREFLVSDKPVAALGAALATILEAAGAAGRTIAAHGPLKSALERGGATTVEEPIHVDEALITASGGADIETFAKRFVEEISERLEERDVDEMSEQSFPASDAPSTTPARAGPASGGETRP